ncbi:hypothetical protein VTN77DRAFT_3823 [Rasamsonia byssochlamydoides]|uniref:uncharacterized protein n=1 Tax=Rasamsonia byssochlamydoides TaxID=89139 RepID=UPI003743526C
MHKYSPRSAEHMLDDMEMTLAGHESSVAAVERDTTLVSGPGAGIITNHRSPVPNLLRTLHRFPSWNLVVGRARVYSVGTEHMGAKQNRPKAKRAEVTTHGRTKFGRDLLVFRSVRGIIGAAALSGLSLESCILLPSVDGGRNHSATGKPKEVWSRRLIIEHGRRERLTGEPPAEVIDGVAASLPDLDPAAISVRPPPQSRGPWH